MSASGSHHLTPNSCGWLLRSFLASPARYGQYFQTTLSAAKGWRTPTLDSPAAVDKLGRVGRAHVQCSLFWEESGIRVLSPASSAGNFGCSGWTSSSAYLNGLCAMRPQGTSECPPVSSHKLARLRSVPELPTEVGTLDVHSTLCTPQGKVGSWAFLRDCRALCQG